MNDPSFQRATNVWPGWCKLDLGIGPTLCNTLLGKLTCALALDILKLIHRQYTRRKFHLHTPSLKHLKIHVYIGRILMHFT